jgi:SAM-dependent methyltransferase
MSTADPARTRGLDAWAGDYDRYRPGYPDVLFEVIAQRLPIPRQPHVVDLGAGTGRASLDLLRGRAWNVAYCLDLWTVRRKDR